LKSNAIIFRPSSANSVVIPAWTCGMAKCWQFAWAAKRSSCDSPECYEDYSAWKENNSSYPDTRRWSPFHSYESVKDILASVQNEQSRELITIHNEPYPVLIAIIAIAINWPSPNSASTTSYHGDSTP
jgi:hypothetical protein